MFRKRGWRFGRNYRFGRFVFRSYAGQEAAQPGTACRQRQRGFLGTGQYMAQIGIKAGWRENQHWQAHRQRVLITQMA